MHPKLAGRICALLLAAIGISSHAYGQSGARATDSLRTYRLSEIVIGADVEPRHSMGAIRRIPIAAIVREDAVSAASLVRLIPSAHLQTNSRGESLVYIRDAGERQVGVFFDGALLNVPWDYRVDMSLIPAGMLGGVSVSRGIPSVVYGTNVIGGAVNLQSRSLSGNGSHVEIGAQIGSNEARQVHATYLRKTTNWSAVASGSFFSTAGQALPSGADLKFSQDQGSVRTNTDRRIGNVFLRLGRRFSKLNEVGLSLLHIESEKGVAPEGHIDPSIDRVRYWRYPRWQNTMLILNAVADLGPTGQLSGAMWLGRFGQHIEQFEDERYEARTDLQKDRDLTIGFRVIGDIEFGPGVFRSAVNWLTSVHTQTDIEYSSSGSSESVLENRYRQMLYAIGTEYEAPVGRGLSALLGASIDGTATPKTGDKPSRKADLAAAMTAGLRKDLGANTAVRWSAGRKIRFPTMRELFGEALQRFALNPDLGPETSFQTEVAVEGSDERFAGEAVVFYRRTYDTIDQEIVEVNGERKRRRVNLDGSRVWGIETGGTSSLSRVISVEGHITWMDPVGFEAGRTVRLNEKPELLGSLSVRLSFSWGGSLQLTGVHTGRAAALAPDNTQVDLPSSTIFNARISMRRYFSMSGLFVELFAGVNNLADESSFPQLGLPGPGRELRTGASLSF